MKLRKVMAVMLAASMSLGLAACGGSNAAPAATTAAPAAAAPAESKAPETTAAPIEVREDADSIEKAGAKVLSGIGGDADQLAHVMEMPVSSSKDTLSMQVPSDPGSLDPYTTGGGQAAEAIFQNVCEGLFDYGYDYQMVPELAESWEMSDDNLKCTFHLRQGVKYSDGTDFEPEDVLFAIKKCKDHPQKQQYVKNIDIDNIKIVDDHTIEIPLTQPDAYFFSTLKSVKISKEATYTEEGFAEKPIGTGPYVVEEFVGGSYATLKANENYWGGAPAIKTINVKVITDAAQRSIELETGGVDIVSELAENDYGRIAADDRFNAIIRPTFKSESFYFNTTDASIFKDKKARQAVAYAIDKAAIYAAVYQNQFGSIATAFPSSGMIDYNPDCENSYYNFDLDKAKALLAEAGIQPGTKISIINNGNKTASTNCEIVQAMLAQIGLEASITAYEKAVYNSVVDDAAGGWDMATVDFTAPSGYVADMAFAYFAWEGINRSKLQNSELNDLVHEATQIVDDVERAETTDKIVKLIQEELPGYTYHRQAVQWAWNKQLKGFNVWGQNGIRFKYMYFE